MTLFLFPNVLGPVKDHRHFLPHSVDQAVSQIDGLIAESEGEGRRYLKRFETKKKPHLIPIALMSKKMIGKKIEALDFLLEPILRGETWGVVSDCGLPCLADPGAALVMRARVRGIPIRAFTGPCSITHALMLSGLPAQNFVFHGYAPKNPQERRKVLKTWEKEKGMTHLFIEAPYRNIHTFQSCLDILQDTTLLCVASDLTLENEWIEVFFIKKWKEQDFQFICNHFFKKPTIFLFAS